MTHGLHRRFISARHLILFALVALLLSSCSVVQIVINSSMEAQMLRDGEIAFTLGNYKKAENLFEKVYSSETDQQTKNTALYNLVCTRMIQGKNARDVTEAISLLEAWNKSYSIGIYAENPDFIITALQKSRSLILQEIDQTARVEEKMLKSKQAQTKIVEDLTAQLDALDITAKEYQKQIETLQHQIKELEEIDQQTQEKKKPL